MTDRLSASAFLEQSGVGDWRVVDGRARARFRTGSFATGVRLVEVIGTLADAANHHPDVDLRYADVTVTLVTHEIGALSQRDVDLARLISEAAHRLDITADPAALT